MSEIRRKARTRPDHESRPCRYGEFGLTWPGSIDRTEDRRYYSAIPA